jgi:hypothetical protein
MKKEKPPGFVERRKPPTLSGLVTNAKSRWVLGKMQGLGGLRENLTEYSP